MRWAPRAPLGAELLVGEEALEGPAPLTPGRLGAASLEHVCCLKATRFARDAISPPFYVWTHSRLHSTRNRSARQGTGYRYHVEFDVEIVNRDSPRCPNAIGPRASLARGYSGKVTLLDGKDTKPRTVVSIEKAAQLSSTETGSRPSFARREPSK